MTHRLIAICSGLLLAVLVAAPKTYAESWTDLSGTRTIEARMVGLWNDTLVLQLEGGRRITVKLDDLQAASRIQAQNMAREHSSQRGALIGELEGQAKEAAAPAPTPLPTPAAPAAYQPPTKDTDCVSQLRWLVDQSNAGHLLRAQYDSQPASYRTDIDEIAKLVAQKLDPAIIQNVVGAVHQAGDLIVTRQRWMFSHPKLETLPPTSKDKIKEIGLAVGNLARVGLNPQALDLQKLQSTPFKDWLYQYSDSVAPYVGELMRLQPSNPSFEPVNEKDGVATVKVSNGGDSVTQSYTKVDGFWVESSTASTWAQDVSDQKKKLIDLPNGTYLAGGPVSFIPTLVQPMLQPLAQATNRRDFHAAMEPLLLQTQAAVDSLSLYAGASLGRGRSSRGMDDMDMMDEMDMDMMDDMDMDMDGMEEEMMMEAEMRDTMRNAGGPN